MNASKRENGYQGKKNLRNDSRNKKGIEIIEAKISREGMIELELNMENRN